MQIVILAGGLGTRLKPFTETTPKGMITIKGKPFLQYQLELLKKHNFTSIILCIGHLSDKFTDYFEDGGKFGVNIKYSIEKDRLLGTAGAIKNAQDCLEDEFMLLYGDSYLPMDYAKFASRYKRTKLPALMAVYKNNNEFDKSNASVTGNMVTEYNKRSLKKLVYIDYGASILNKKIIAGLPANTVIQLENVFSKLAANGELGAFEVESRFYEIGSLYGLEQFKLFVQRGYK